MGLLGGILAALLMLMLGAPEGVETRAWSVAAVAVLMAAWWLTEAIPLPATALVPVALLPLLGAAPIKEVAAAYANSVIFLFLGGFLIVIAMQKWNLHKRVALWILTLIGTRPERLVAGFALVSYGFSMWVSNAAAAAMMLPIAVSVIGLLGANPADPGDPARQNLTVNLLLAVAFGTTVGGMATIIGTPPNAVMAGYLADELGIEVSFLTWMSLGLPLSLTLLVATWVILTRFAYPVGAEAPQGMAEALEIEIRNLGPISRPEIVVGIVFIATALMWIGRPIVQSFLPAEIVLTDAGIAVVAALILFLMPVNPKEQTMLLTWGDTKDLPWGVLVLFGGGLSLGSMIGSSGLSAAIAGALGALSDLPLIVIAGSCAVVATVVSHLTSNTATTSAFVPIIASLAISLGEPPLMLVLPVTFAATAVFMLPVATPPNAIAFSTGLVTMPQMVRAGAMLNAVALVLIILIASLMPALGFRDL